jgi:hypothetical protein
MNNITFKYSGVPRVVILAQITAILLYFNLNINNFTGFGTSLEVLVAFFGLSGVILIFLWLQKSFYFRLHFFVFVVFLGWIIIRNIIDIAELKSITSITIETNDGILLFYLIGAFFNITYVWLQEKTKNITIQKLILLIYLTTIIYTLLIMLERRREDIFLISDFNYDYQRSGNFNSISFIIASAVFISLMSKSIGVNTKKLESLIWFSLYSIVSIAAIVSSQLIGSNSATAVISGVYIITVNTNLMIHKRNLYRLYDGRKFTLHFTKIIKSTILNLILACIFLCISIYFVIYSLFDYSILNILLLGFGSGNNTSLTSRFDILVNNGLEQMSYAPLLGNTNVTYLTGNESQVLHSFFPFILANLGILGLIIIFTFFFLIYLQLYNRVQQELCSAGSIGNAFTQLYLSLILSLILFIANLATGVSWSVIWFAVGFISQPFGFKRVER